MTKAEHDEHTNGILEEGRQNFSQMRVGDTSVLPVGIFRPSQPDDRRRSHKNSPIEVDEDGLVIHGNHRWWTKWLQGRRTKIFVTKVQSPYNL